ncbi:MAG: fasciclin domain-containing protein [Clostridium sp.]|nr:fasciclin domain-containing protein [Clostridium sp.]
MAVGVGLSLALCNVSCADDYPYDDGEPSFVNSNVYDYLKADSRFSTYVRLIDDNRDLPEILQRTGTRTLFPATDDAFARFFNNNPFGARRYEDLTVAQKRLLLNSSMINMMYLSGTLSNMPNLGDGTVAEGMAVRRPGALSILDSVSSVTVTDAPNIYWEKYAGRKIPLLASSEAPRLVHFTERLMDIKGITDEDMRIVFGADYRRGNLYINNARVTEKDIICKNGYLHVVDEVLLPAQSVDEIISRNPDNSTFYELMNRFSRPQYLDDVNKTVQQRYDGSDKDYPVITDSVFFKRYFTESVPFEDMRETGTNAPKMDKYGLLYFDPSDNSYSSSGDFGVMFVPTNEAMETYFSESKFLKDAYGTWENVPTYIASMFVKNHQKKSFMSSLPHTWDTMTDEASFVMGVKKEDIKDVVVGGNGVVYVTNKVYPPVDYQCVYASTLNSPVSTIAKWALQDDQMKFKVYLRSMENMYNLIVPTDEAFLNYRDPISAARGRGEIWEFHMDEVLDQPYVLRYEADDSAPDGKGAFIAEQRNIAILRNRLADIFDTSIVVGNKDLNGNMSGYLDDLSPRYVITKGGSTIYVHGQGDNIHMAGGADLADNRESSLALDEQGIALRYEAENGRTYFVDRILQNPVKSVYQTLSTESRFSTFFELLNGDEVVASTIKNELDIDLADIFSLKKSTSSSGLGNVVNSFSNFHYTVFVPTNDALKNEFANNPELKNWSEIRQLCVEGKTSEAYKYAEKLLNMLRYHFMDNSVYIGGDAVYNQYYQTAARESGNASRFARLTVNSSANGLYVLDNTGRRANVVMDNGCYNIMTRDLIVNSGDYMSADQIISSSRAVVHLIDNVLKPE